ncbi:MAG: PQQ-binding-like beta-propeller repeat protein, partial [Pseudomonadales bacterium]|nr:PQQ-binding-like beta-propeller repeat protein [Pseudomonadales bacterium]
MNNSQPSASVSRWPVWVAALGVLVFGLLFVAGGGYLATLGGSLYFLLAGLGMIAASVLMFKQRLSGVWLFAAVMVASIVWALLDAGLVFWPLVSRLFALAVLSLVVALAYPSLRKANGLSGNGGYALGAVLAVAIAGGFWGMFQPHATVSATGDGPGLTKVDPANAQKDWAHYGNDEGGSRFAALDQINRSNVADLVPAWTYQTGDVAISDGNGAEDQLTPLQVGDKVFICTPHNNLIALDADTGKELWKNNIDAKSAVWQRCRGLAYFDASAPVAQPTDGSTPAVPVAVAPGAACQRRLLTNTIDARLIAVDADTGKFCQDFGTNGQVDLKAGLGNVPDSFYQLSSAPLMAGTTVVVGGRVADNVQTDMPGGVIRGFDVITGAMRWAFDPGNPQNKQAPAEGQTYVRSTPNS